MIVNASAQKSSGEKDKRQEYIDSFAIRKQSADKYEILSASQYDQSLKV